MSAQKRPLDRIDRALLRALSNDARRSNKELAADVGLAPSTCHGRVRRLVEEGALQGFHARVDPSAFGIGIRAIIFVQLHRHHKDLLADLRARALEQPEVVDVFYVAGSHDLLVHVAVRDVDHLRTLVGDTFSAHDAVGHLETSLIFEHHQAASLPMYSDGSDRL